MSDQLGNIDSLLVRNEYKVRIYSEYFLGACRFMFSIHDLGKSQISGLEDLTHSYLKRWLGLPRCASWAIVHDVHGLGIKSIFHMYEESRALSLSNIQGFFLIGVCVMLWIRRREGNLIGVGNSPQLSTLKG